MRIAIAAAACLGTAALLAGCGSAAGKDAERAASGSASQPSSAPADEQPSTPAGPAAAERPKVAKVITAGGVSQYLNCQGQGANTLVIIPGLGTGSDAWNDVLPELRAMTRTCIYDRPGIGRSPARSGEADTDAGDQARELKALLDEAGESGPYVVTGHSYGGLIARAFAKQNLAEVSGAMLAEGVVPGDPTIGDSWPEAGGSVDLNAGSRAAGDGPKLGSVPLVVLTVTDPDRDRLGGPSYGQSQATTQVWIDLQRKSSQLSKNSLFLVAKSAHVVQSDNPAATIKAAQVLLTAITDGSPLQCGDGWKRVNTTCSAG